MSNGDEDGTDHTSIVIKDDGASIVKEDDDSPTVREDDDIDIELEALKNPLTSKLPRCIFRVPELLRRHNLYAYEPDVVSIGPLHPRGNEQFQAMEKQKHEYLQELLSRMNISLETLTQRVFAYFSDLIRKSDGNVHTNFKKHACDFYAEPLDPDQHEGFIDMIIRDGCFLVQLFRKFIHKKERNINDPIFNIDCMFQYICHDLLLLENQIPWFVLECLYGLTAEYYPQDPSLRELLLTIFKEQRQLTHNCKSYLSHLSHGSEDKKHILHILDLIRTSIVFSFRLDEFKKPFYDANIQFIPSATALSEAGIKFKMISSRESKSILNIGFKSGVISIPHLAIGELTESIFRNLIAFEQCCHGRSHKITSYAVLMDNLIGSTEDMQFLCDKKIISNWLSAANGSEFFSKLYNDTVLKDFYYDGLCANVYEKQTALRRWRETFNRNYCSDPWKATSWVAACILLGLTALQTAYTIKQYYG